MLRAIRSATSAGALLGLAVAAGVLSPLPLRAEQPDVRATLVAPRSVAPGASAKFVVELTVGKGWHVNSHAPHEKFLIPTDLALEAKPGELSPVRYPSGVDRSFPFSDQPMSVYEGTVRFEADLAVPSGASGEAAVSGTLSFQACNAQQCFPPAKIPLSARVSVGS